MKKRMFACAAVLLLVACTENGFLLRSSGKDYISKDTNGIYKIGNPYQVNGSWCYPKEDFTYREAGIASWYGPDFHRGITANGEKYDMHSMTAAHKTLPLPSIVKVTNLENGNSVIVRVNDRGPFVNNRVIDVSKAAAEKLDFIDQGTVQVRVEIMEAESRALKEEILKNGGRIVSGEPLTEAMGDPSVATSAMVEKIETVKPVTTGTLPITSNFASGYYIQMGAFTEASNADKLGQQLKVQGCADVHLMQANVNGQSFVRVRVGPFKTPDEAVALMDQLERKGLDGGRLVQEITK